MSPINSKILAITVVILISGFSASLTDFGISELRNSFDNNSPTPIPEIITEIDRSTQNYQIDDFRSLEEMQRRILWFNSYEARDQAILNIDQEKIGTVFDFIPAFSTYDLLKSEIPLEGIRQIIDDKKIVKQASKVDQLPLSEDINVGVTLKKSASIINIPFLRDLELTGKGVKIAIVDSGVNGDLKGFEDANGVSRVTELSVDDLTDVPGQSAHGTHVAGIVGGNGYYNINGETKLYDSPGIAPGVEIISVKVLNEDGFGFISWIVEGIMKAVAADVDIISLSLSSEFYNGSDDVQKAAVDFAVSQGIIVVAAAGNLGPFGAGIGVPGTFDNVIAVGASDLTSDDFIKIWPNSGVGPRVGGYPGPDVVAPGGSILSLNMNGGTLSLLSGTSMATPHISGGIALLKEKFPSVTLNQIREALTSSAIDLGVPVERQGRGLVDFKRAYEILSATNESRETERMMSSAPNIIKDENYIYRNKIINHTKVFDFFIHSSRNINAIPVINLDFNYGVELVVPNFINITEGLNKFQFSAKINTSKVEFVSAQIYFIEDSSKLLIPYANISYFAFTAYSRGKILFDVSKDMDTPFGYFGGHKPTGQFSQYSRILEAEGHIVIESSKTITSSLLSDVDVLILSDPDLGYTNSEINAIRNFAFTDGKAILILAGGGLLTAEEFEYASFNSTTLEKILDGTGISFKKNSTGGVDVSIGECDLHLNVFVRLDSCFRLAETTQTQSVLSTLKKFPHFGPELETTQISGVEVQEIASIDGKIVVAAAELASKGRILVFSSPLVFDNKALELGYQINNPDLIETSKDITMEAMDWLLEPRSMKTVYTFNGEIASDSIDINLHEEVSITLEIFKPNGDIIFFQEDTIEVSVVLLLFDINGNPFVVFDEYTFFKDNDGSYTYIQKFSQYGVIDFYILIEDPDGEFIPSNGHIKLNIDLLNFELQDDYRLVAAYMFFALMFSWILFIVNEGGRNLKKKKENEEK